MQREEIFAPYWLHDRVFAQPVWIHILTRIILETIMAMTPRALLRIYAHDERTVWPDEWPENIGVVCLWRNGQIDGVSAFHEDESDEVVVERALEAFDMDAVQVASHPKVKGLSSHDLDVSEDIEISLSLDDFLDRNEEEVEAACDFAVNYEFAASEGLPPEEIVPGLKPVSGSRRKPALPSGYSNVDDLDRSDAVFSGAYLRFHSKDVMHLVIPGVGNDDLMGGVSVLARDDGTGFAIAVDQLLAHERPYGVIEVPAAALSISASVGSRMDVLVSLGDTHLYATAMPHTLTAGVQRKAAPPKKSVRPAKILRAVATTFFVAVLLVVFAFLMTEDEWDVGQTAPVGEVSAADELQSMMFDADRDISTVGTSKVDYLIKRVREKDWYDDLGLDVISETLK